MPGRDGGLRGHVDQKILHIVVVVVAGLGFECGDGVCRVQDVYSGVQGVGFVDEDGGIRDLQARFVRIVRAGQLVRRAQGEDLADAHAGARQCR